MIIEFVIRAVKSLFGFQNDHRSTAPRKRPLYRLDFEVSDDDDDDDDSDYERSCSKRRKVESVDLEAEASTSSYNMADWIKPRKGFAQSYFYKPLWPEVTKKPVEPKTITITDDSGDEIEQVIEDPTEASWQQKSPRNASHQHRYSSSASSGRRTKSSRLTRGAQGLSIAAESFLAQPHYTTRAVRHNISQRVQNGTEQPTGPVVCVTNGHNHQEGRLTGHYEGAYSSQVKLSMPLSRKKRGATAVECFRLEDKERYRQLLQHYSTTTNPLLSGYNGQAASKSTSRPMFSDVVKGVPVPEVQVLKDQSKRQFMTTPALVKDKLSETRTQYHTRSILLKSHSSETPRSLRPKLPPPDVEILESETETSRSFARRGRSRQKTDLEASKAKADISIKPDDSVVITKEVVVPRWKQTLNNMGGFEYTSPAWLRGWKKKLAADREEKQRKIEAAQQNCTRLEKSLETMVNKMHLSATEEMPEIIEEVFMPEEEQEEELEPLPELTPEMEETIDDASCPTPPDELLVQGFRLQIRRRDMETLQDLNWLNDEVINFYMNLLMERGKDDNMPSVYAVNTFFYPKLISGGHDALKRWTRKIDIFAHEIMLVPVHLGVHWCLAVVNFKDKTVIYYDSMGGNNNECLNALSDYLQAECLDKKKKPFDMADWDIKNAKDIPQQMNSSDCGMFACKYAEYITRNAKITFKQEHMPYFRRRMVYEIMKKRLL